MKTCDECPGETKFRIVNGVDVYDLCQLCFYETIGGLVTDNEFASFETKRPTDGGLIVVTCT